MLLSLQSFLREGRVVGLCWAQSKPKGPKNMSFRGSSEARPENLRPYFGSRIESWCENVVSDFLRTRRNKSKGKINFSESGPQNFWLVPRSNPKSEATFVNQLSILFHKSVLRFSEHSSEQDISH